MRLVLLQLVGIIAVVLIVPGHVLAQNKPATKSTQPKVAPAAPLKDGWEEIDKRLLFLMVRLANVEASLDAVEKKLGVNARQQAARVGDAKRAELGNEMMDRKGGGPVKWSQFYGRTAEKFFYHPTDRNTTYHTTTVLGQRSPVDDNQVEPGVPSRQGLPVHQRPPQFDYIYKANRDAQARAEREVQQLRNKVDALQARRRQLEDEQAALWCQIAFRAVTRYDFARKPLFRFEPTAAAADTVSRQQAEAVKAAAIFMRRGLSIVEEAEKNQARAFGNIKAVIADANEKLDDSLLQLDTLTADTSSHETAIGRFSALARRLKDIADNISDSYEVSIDGDRFKDEVRKDTFRGLLQESLVDYAEVLLAMNEMALLMESEAKTKPDVNMPLKFVSLEMPERVVRSEAPNADEEIPAVDKQPEPKKVANRTTTPKRTARGSLQTLTFDTEDNVRQHWKIDGRWQIENKALKLARGSSIALVDELSNNFELYIILEVRQKLGTQNPHNRLLLSLYGEEVVVPLADCKSIYVRSDGISIDVVTNDQPQQGKRLEIKSANRPIPAKIGMKIESLASNEEWHPDVWLLKAQLKNRTTAVR